MALRFLPLVFLSSVTAELGQERDELARILMIGDPCHPVFQRNFEHSAVDTLEMLDGKVRECALVVQVLGNRSGAVANEKAVQTYLAAIEKDRPFLGHDPELRQALGDFSGLTYTHWEAYIAQHHAVPLLSYLVKNVSEVSPPPDAAELARCARHLRWLYLARHRHLAYRDWHECATHTPQHVMVFLRKFLAQDPAASRPETAGKNVAAVLPVGPRRRIVDAVSTLAIPRFQGRVGTLGSLRSHLLNKAVRIIVVSGQGGMGKTTLISKFITDLEHDGFMLHGVALPATFPADAAPPAVSSPVEVEAVLFVDLKKENRRSPDNIIALLCELLDPDKARQLRDDWGQPSSLDAKLDCLFDKILGNGRRPFLVVLDNFEDLLAPASNNLRPEYADIQKFIHRAIRDEQRGTRIIVTTRYQLNLTSDALKNLTALECVRLPLNEGLAEGEAVQLLRALDADGACGMQEESEAALAEVARLAKGVPNTLVSLFSVLGETGMDLEQFRRLQEARFRRLMDDPARELYESLAPEARQVMQALAIFGTPASDVAVGFLLPGVDVFDVLRQFEVRCVVEVERDRKRKKVYALHRLNQNYAYDQIPTEGKQGRSSLHHYAATYFQKTAMPLAEAKELADLDPRLQAISQHLLAGEHEAAAADLDAISPLLQRRGNAALAAEQHGRLLEVPLIPATRLRNLLGLGRARLALGNPRGAESILDQALALAREAGDSSREADALNELGNAEVSGGYGRAREFFQAALDIHRRLADRVGEGNDLCGLSTFCWSQGEYLRSAEYAREAVTVHHTAGHAAGEGDALCRLGYALTWLGEYHPALDAFNQAIALQRAAGNQRGEAEALCGIGSPHWYLGDLRAAHRAYEDSLRIRREINDRRGVGDDFDGLGWSSWGQGWFRRAADYFQRALDIHRSVRDRHNEASDLCGLAYTYTSEGEIPRAIECLRESASIYGEIRDPYGASMCGYALGVAHAAARQFAEARGDFTKGIRRSQELPDISGEADNLAGLAGVDLETGQPGAARARYQQALELHRKASNQWGEGCDLHGLGRANLQAGLFAESAACHEQAIELLQKVGDTHTEIQAWRGLAEACQRLDQPTRAAECTQKAEHLAAELASNDH